MAETLAGGLDPGNVEGIRGQATPSAPSLLHAAPSLAKIGAAGPSADADFQGSSATMDFNGFENTQAMSPVAVMSAPPPNDLPILISLARAGDVVGVEGWVRAGGDLQRRLDARYISWTPLQFVCAEGDTVAVHTLLKAGAQPGFGDSHDGYTPLHISARYGHVGIMKLLLASGASVHAIDSSGHNPLHYAATSGQTPAAHLLLEAGIDYEGKNHFGRSPLDLAVAHGSRDIAQAIRQKRAESASTSDSKTAAWLSSIGLGQYSDLLVLSGWDDIDFIADVGFTEADLDSMGISKAGHRRKLLAAYKAKDFASVSSNAARPGGDKSDGKKADDESDDDDDDDSESDESDSESDDDSDDDSESDDSDGSDDSD
eukprot:g2445.t1